MSRGLGDVYKRQQMYNKKIMLFRMSEGLMMESKASESVVKEIVNCQCINRKEGNE